MRRMPPAYQRLETDDPALDPWPAVIVQREFRPGDGGLQVVLQGVPFAQLQVHLGLEEAHRATAFFFGAIERGVRVGEQRGGVGAVGRKIGGRCSVPCATGAVDFNVSATLAGSGREPRPHWLVARRRRHHDELIAARRARMRHRRPPGGDLRSRAMSHRRRACRIVVDFLEPVDIDAQERERLILTRGALEHLGNRSLKG